MRKVMWWSTTPLTISKPSKSTFRTTRSLTRLARLECRRMLDWTTSSGSWLSTERAAEWTQWGGSVQFHHASQNLWEVSKSKQQTYMIKHTFLLSQTEKPANMPTLSVGHSMPAPVPPLLPHPWAKLHSALTFCRLPLYQSHNSKFPEYKFFP